MGLEDILKFDGLKIKGYKQETSDNGETTLVFNAIPSDTTRPLCPACGAGGVYSDGYKERTIRDISIQDNKVIVNVLVGKYNCQQCNKTFQKEILEFAEKGSTISNRLKEAIARECAVKTFASASIKYDVSPASASNIFETWAERLDKERQKVIKAPEVLGIDEAHLANIMRGVYIDSKDNILCGTTPTRNKEAVAEFIKSLDGYENIKVVTMDMWVGYRSTVYEVLGNNVCIIADRFHVIKDLTDKAIKARRAIVAKAGNPKLGNNANLMKKNLENLTDKEKEELMDQFAIVPELSILYGLKESFRTIYNCKTKEEALECYDKWCASIPERIKDETTKGKKTKNIDRFDEIRKFQKTVEEWKREIFNYFDYRVTNAGTEAINGLIKIVNRVGRGYSYKVLSHKIQYGLRACDLPKKKVFVPDNKSSDMMNDGFFSYTSPFSFNMPTPKPKRIDRTNNNLTPSIEELYKALLDGKINLDSSEEEENG